MGSDEFTPLLPHLTDSTQVSLKMTAGDLRRAFVMATGDRKGGNYPFRVDLRCLGRGRIVLRDPD